jgi:cytochrome c553
MKHFAVLTTLTATLALPALSQTPPTRAAAAPSPTEAPAHARTGQQIATGGASNGVTACVGCHGAQGEGNAASGFPRIAGQSEDYLARQILAFANGKRNNTVMTPLAKVMNEQQIRDVCAYYAGLATPAAAGGTKLPAAALRRGQLLATKGDESKHVQACANCHGPNGMGEPPSYPSLAGQHAAYLSTAMTEWKNGTRNSDPSGQMPEIAKMLSADDVAALSAYYTTQPVPPPAGKMINIAAGTVARPAVSAAPNAPGPKGPGADTIRGTGSKQGAPTTGGNQGSGGGGGATPPVPPRK